MQKKLEIVKSLKEEMADLRTVTLTKSEIAYVIRTRQSRSISISGTDLALDLQMTAETQNLQQALLKQPAVKKQLRKRKNNKKPAAKNPPAKPATKASVDKATALVDGQQTEVTVET